MRESTLPQLIDVSKAAMRRAEPDAVFIDRHRRARITLYGFIVRQIVEAPSELAPDDGCAINAVERGEELNYDLGLRLRVSVRHHRPVGASIGIGIAVVARREHNA